MSGIPVEAVGAFNCPSCGTELPPSAMYCFNCGARVGGVTDPEQESRLRGLQLTAPDKLRQRMRTASSEFEGNRKPVTILFTDIVGSTSIAERLDPEEWREIVAGAHRRVGEAIHRYEGTIAQLLGDGVLAFFGAPITHEDDPIRAVRAALDIQEAIGVYEADLAGLIDHFEMRIGINSGTVVLGEIGSDLHVEYLAVGDAVNTASRLQSAANPREVLISDSTARLIGNDFSVEDRGEIEVKGKSEVVRASAVTGLIGIPHVTRGFSSERAPYIGRAIELETLQSDLRTLSQGQGRIVAILGEPGIGKTRLVEEARRLSEDEHIRWLEGRALSYGSSLSFWLITQLLLSDLELSDGTAAVKIKVKLRKRVAELFGEDASKAYPYLGHLLGLTEDADVQEGIRESDGETVKRQTLISVTEYFQKAAEQIPTVLVLEDLHWADPSSLEAVSRLMLLVERTSLVVLMPMRMEREHGSWRLRLDAETDLSDHFTKLHLKRLPDDEAIQLVEDLLGNEVAAEEIRDLARSRAGGNPLHIEEIIRHLIEQGLIKRTNGDWQPTAAIGEVGIPSTLEGILLARIDRLETEVRNTLQLASVIGRSFLYQILEAVSEADRELEWQMSKLQRADLVREKTRQPELEYIFKHALTQEAAYNSLLVETRKEFHLRVGEAIERLFPDREVEKLAGQLARHFQIAGITEKAISYRMMAARRAISLSANEEAIEHLNQALDLTKDLPASRKRAKQDLRVLTMLGSAYAATRGYSSLEAKEVYDRARELCDVHGIKGPRHLFILVGLWGYYFDRGEHEEGLRLAREILSVAEELGGSQFLEYGHWVVGNSLSIIGEFIRSLKHFEQGNSIYDPNSRFLNAAIDPAVQGLALTSLLTQVLGYPDQAINRVFEARSMAEGISQPSSRIYSSLYLATVHQVRREFDQALEFASDTISLGTRHNDRELIPAGLAIKSWALSKLGRPTDVVEDIKKAIGSYQSTGSRVYLPYMHSLLGAVLGDKEKYDDGISSLEEALAWMEKTGQHFFESEIYRLMGEMSAARDFDGQKAEQFYRRALHISRSQGAKFWELQASMSLCRLWQKQGNSAEARELLEPIYQWFSEGFDTPDLVEAKALLNDISQE